MAPTFPPAELKEYLAFAHCLADAARPEIMRHFRVHSVVEDKADREDGGYSPVTAADRGAEAAMRALIRARYPEHGIMGEEHGHEGTRARLTWVIDPLDGTRAFISGLPLFGTLIALNVDGKPVLGIMDQPVLKERFVGCAGASYLGEQRLKTRPCTRLDQATLFCTEPDMFGQARERAAFDAVAGRVRLRRFGGDCYAYCMLALGFVDLVVEGSLKPWDIQALIPIIEGAGGVVTGWDGGPAEAGGLVVAAGDPRLHAKVLPLLAEAVG